MLEKYANAFYSLGVILEDTIALTFFSAGESEIIDKRVIEKLKNELETALSSCRFCGLKTSAVAIEEYLSRPEDHLTRKNVNKWLSEISETIRRELLSFYLFHVSSDKIVYYQNPLLFGEKVAKSFPSSSFDIEEAGNCLVFNRSTSCIFHLMRAMETPLELLASKLEIGYAPNWNKYLEQVDKIAKEIRENKRTKPADWSKLEKFYNEASGLLRNVKNSWRNEVMHLEKKYTEEEAQRIFVAVKGFMEFLAEHLREEIAE